MGGKRLFQNVTILCNQRNDAGTSIEYKHKLLELNFVHYKIWLDWGTFVLNLD